MSATAAPTTAATRSTTVTLSSNMARAWSAVSPAASMSDSKRSPPTRTTPIATIPSATATTTSDAASIRLPMPRTLMRVRPAGRSPELQPLDRAGRPVADAPDGGDVARGVRVVAELLAEPLRRRRRRPDRVTSPSAVAVERVEQLVAAEDAAVRLEERLEQAELERAQGDLAPAHASPGGGSRSSSRSPQDRSVAAGSSSRARSVRRRIVRTRATSSAGENGFGR